MIMSWGVTTRTHDRYVYCEPFFDILSLISRPSDHQLASFYPKDSILLCLGFKGDAIVDFLVVKMYKLLVSSLNVSIFLENH